MLLNNFDLESDFWDSNPEMKILFKKYKDTPSKVMWGLFLIYHPESKFSEEDENTRISLVKDDFLEDKSFKISDYEDLIQIIKDSVLTRAERRLLSWKKKLEERDVFEDTLSYTTETFEVVDKVLTQGAKLWDAYETVISRYNKEKEGRTTGDIQESLSEQGTI
jgi:hypothetical protein